MNINKKGKCGMLIKGTQILTEISWFLIYISHHNANANSRVFTHSTYICNYLFIITGYLVEIFYPITEFGLMHLMLCLQK